MPVHRSRAPRRKVRRARRAPRARIGRSLAVKAPQMARIIETIEGNDLFANNNYANIFSLRQFTRASQLAPCFKFYRATKVTWTYDPLYNTFQESGSGAAPGAPYFYSRMNRTQDNYNYTVTQLQQMGATPKRFTSQRKITYRPNWMSPGLGVARQNTEAPYDVAANGSLGAKVQYSWLPSPGPAQVPGQPIADSTVMIPANAQGPIAANVTLDPIFTNTVTYNGHSLFIDQQYLPTDTTWAVCRLTCTVHWEFKDPNFELEPVRQPLPSLPPA